MQGIINEEDIIQHYPRNFNLSNYADVLSVSNDHTYTQFRPTIKNITANEARCEV